MIPLKLQYFESLDARRRVTGCLASLFSGTLYQSPSYNRDILGLVEHCCSNHHSSVAQCWGSGQLDYDFNATITTRMGCIEHSSGKSISIAVDQRQQQYQLQYRQQYQQ